MLIKSKMYIQILKRHDQFDSRHGSIATWVEGAASATGFRVRELVEVLRRWTAH